MQFILNVSARAGLGISWDEEQPPLYEHIPPSPPKYESTLALESPPVYGVVIHA